ncbi:MAG: asparagine synthase (glutamine-hydrolyzing) [Oscillospiraceae bacterium]|nr:asparagine synthase (glutamine-hydrolyzing) [Oscillospiraceae bacterium]
MCGIAGEVSYSHSVIKNKDSFLRMQKVLTPRGPDQNGLYIKENAALIHSRLCVIDIENGKQPMTAVYDGKEYAIVYNGELYNTDEIRKELTVLGHKFTGHSDTEVILKSFVQWKEACVEKFNGIFAFAIWDDAKKRLFFARDRIGVKPLFYAVRDNSFIFGSEIKALLEHEKIEPIIDENSIAEIMFIGPGRTPGCGVFKGISEMRPASCGYYCESGIKIKKYWTLRDREHTDSFEETVEKVRLLVKDAITRQLVSDVPVGTFLSGGLDSSIISSVANSYFKERGGVLHTFSVTYEDNDKYFKQSKFQPNSDTEYIKIMANYLGCEHHLITLNNKELADALLDAVDARDLPGMADVDSSLLLFCKEIKKHCTVALSGECADEIFGGYPWYRDKTIRMINGFPWAQSTAYRKSFIKDDIKLPDAEEYVYSRYKDTIINTSKMKNITPTESRMKEMMRLNLDWFMQTLLDRKDRMSMYNALEVRVPFCDYRIAEYLYSVPWEFKDYKSYEKGLLREAVTGLLPEEVLWRKKSPYPKTHNPEYLKYVSQMLERVIENPHSPLLTFIKKEELQKLLKTEKSEPWYGQLMTTPQTIAYFVQINYWLEKYKIAII